MAYQPRSVYEPKAIRPLLKRVGLDDREIEVYLALLPLKIARASKISSLAKQSRSHTYLVLKSLITKGLVSEIERGKVLHFVAEPPQRLVTFIKDREQELKDLQPLVEGAIPFLQTLTTPLVGKPRVTTLQGLDGMKQVLRDMLPNEFCALFNPESMYRSFGKNVVSMLFGQDAGLQGRDLLVDNEFAKKYVREVPQDDRYQIRILPKHIQFMTDTIVSGDLIALFAYDAELTIIRIENQNLASSFRSWFDVLWQMSEKTDSSFKQPIV